MPLEESATSVFGDDPRLKPVSMGLFANGGTRNNVSPSQFRQLDDQYMKRAEQILLHKDRVATLREKEQARVQGSQAMGLITGLDATDPNYLSNRNNIISRFPKATLDKSASAFLNLQEDEFSVNHRERERTEARNAANQQQLEMAEKRATSEEEYRKSQSARALADDVRKLSGSAQKSFYASLALDGDPDRAFSMAQSVHDQDERESNFLSEGGSQDELTVTDANGITRPRSSRELDYVQGQRKRDKYKREETTFRIEQISDQTKLLQGQLKDAVDAAATLGASDPNKAGADSLVATLQGQVDSLTGQMADLRKISFGDQGASSGDVSTGGSPTSAITGLELQPPAGPTPAAKKSTGAAFVTKRN